VLDEISKETKIPRSVLVQEAVDDIISSIECTRKHHPSRRNPRKKNE
jgi:hypothetical protein